MKATEALKKAEAAKAERQAREAEAARAAAAPLVEESLSMARSKVETAIGEGRFQVKLEYAENAGYPLQVGLELAKAIEAAFKADGYCCHKELRGAGQFAGWHLLVSWDAEDIGLPDAGSSRSG